MRISDLKIQNFRGIENAEISNAGDTLIIAGQNGSGKSCIFDAIRLLKSVYGGYHQNEWQGWFGEFQVNPNSKSEQLRGMFNDPGKPLSITINFKFRDTEKQFISNNAYDLVEEYVWRTELPEAFQWGGYRMAMFATQFREREPEVKAKAEAQVGAFLQELQSEYIIGMASVVPGGSLKIRSSTLLSALFSNYRPEDLGVIDYHGSQRHYGREAVQGINLSIEQNQTQSQHALYNYSNKYANVKSEMAAGYVKELLAEKAGVPAREVNPLSETMKELFATFFPGKQFLGPQPTKGGQLEFPVRVANGNIHDLDELSAGEKEILYGYLRIRSSAPNNSIILLDEPELHLNPRLIRNLPEFYRKHLGEALNNQLWLVTHSDALLREAVGKPGFGVYHMVPCGISGGQNQLRELRATEDLDIAIADIVGDLAAYRPGGAAIIFEGGGDSDYDQSLTFRLFSTELAGINLLSGSNKTKLSALHEILDRAYSRGDLPTRFYAITDRDSPPSLEARTGLRMFNWDVYHIENYLLEEVYVAKVINALEPTRRITAEMTLNEMRSAARKAVPALVRHRMREHINSNLVSCINLGFDPAAEDIATVASEAVGRSLERINNVVGESLAHSALTDLQRQYEQDFEAAFADGRWKAEVPGREVLKGLVAELGLAVGYEAVRNLIASHMVDDGFKPAGMARVIELVLSDIRTGSASSGVGVERRR